MKLPYYLGRYYLNIICLVRVEVVREYDLRTLTYPLDHSTLKYMLSSVRIGVSAVILLSMSYPTPAQAVAETKEPPSYALSLALSSTEPYGLTESSPPVALTVTAGQSLNDVQTATSKTAHKVLQTPKKVSVVHSINSVNKTSNTPPTSSYTAHYDGGKVIGYSNEQCVQLYEEKANIHISLGYAGNIVSQGDVPRVGAGALSKFFGHIMFVTDVQSDGVQIVEANWQPGKIDTRFVPYSEIRGFVYYGLN